MLLLILAQITASAPIPLKGPEQGTISSYDYPTQAYRHGWEGPVGVDLTVGTSGQVTHCSIIVSSGHDVLDQQTCALMIARARFKPALDQLGRPIEGHVQQRINWRLP